ncbi:hypothetical protein GCM10027431_16940 [Lysobacter rhizosphaerae]
MAVLIVERAAVGALGAVPTQHRVLRRRQALPPFGVAVHHFKTPGHGGRRRRAAAGAQAKQAADHGQAANA